jgi:hypothetical protein
LNFFYSCGDDDSRLSSLWRQRSDEALVNEFNQQVRHAIGIARSVCNQTDTAVAALPVGEFYVKAVCPRLR